jgi:hypothetical protein
VIGDRVFESEAAEPAVSQVQVHFLAQPTLRADAAAEAGEIEESIDAAEQMICRDVCIEVEGVEQSS